MFANVNIQGSNSSNMHALRSSQSTLISYGGIDSDTYSIKFTNVSIPPDIPKRSNSIISMTSTSAAIDSYRPILSPRNIEGSISDMRYQTHVSPRQLNFANEEISNELNNTIIAHFG